MLPTKFKVNKPFFLIVLGFNDSGEEAKNRFSRWPSKQRPWISDQDNFSYFSSTNHHNASYQVSSQLAFQFRRSEK